MFLGILIAFIAFAAVYLFFSIAIIYHLEAYTVDQSPAPRAVSTLFVTTALILFGFAGYFLLAIPR